MKKILLLLVALFATSTVWAADFITDVMVIGGSKSEVNSLKTTYTNQGWTVIDQDLNAGCGSGSDYIYMLYKTGSNASQDAGAFITDFYISTESGTVPDNVIYNGRTYTIVPCDGSTYFKNNKGDLAKVITILQTMLYPYAEIVNDMKRPLVPKEFQEYLDMIQPLGLFTSYKEEKNGLRVYHSTK